MNRLDSLAKGLSLIVAALVLIASQAVEPAKQAKAVADDSVSRGQPTLVAQLGHSEPVKSVAFSPDGNFVVTGSEDNTARLWEVETGREVRVFPHSAQVHSVAFSPNGKCVLTGSWDKTARLWDAETGRVLRIFEGHSDRVNAVAFSPDGRYIVTASDDKTARLWEIETAREMRTFVGHSSGVWSVAFSPDGKYVLTGGVDETARLWETETARELRRFEGHSGGVWSVAFSPDGKSLLTGSFHQTSRLRDARTGSELQRFPIVLSSAFSPDGKHVVAFSDDDPSARLHDAQTGIEVRRFIGHSDEVSSAAFSPNGKYVLTGSEDNTARLWDAETGSELQKFGGHSMLVESVEVSANGENVLTGGFPRKSITQLEGNLDTPPSPNALRLWNTTSGSELRRFPFALSLSPDGKYVVTLSDNGITARLWEAESGKELRRFVGHSEEILLAVFSPNGKYLLTSSFDQTARFWEVGTGRLLRKFPTSVGAAAFSPNGKYLIVVAMQENAAWLCKPDTGEAVKKFENDSSFSLGSVAFSRDGDYLLTCSDAARLWETETGRLVGTFREHSRLAVVSAALSPSGKHVVTGSHEAARLWDAGTGKELRSFVGHPGGVLSVAFSPDGKYVLTAGDSTTRLWSISSGEELCSLVSFHDGTWAVIDPEGRFDTNNLEEIKGLHWIMPDDPMKPLPLEIFMRDYYQPKLLTKLLDDIPDNQQFKPLRKIAELNRSQPQVKIKSIKQQDNAELATVTVEVSRAGSDKQKDRNGKPRETDVYDLRLFRDRQIVGQNPAQQVAMRENTPSAQGNDAAALELWRSKARVDLKGKESGEVVFNDIRLPSVAKDVQFSAYAFNEDRVKSKTDTATALLGELSSANKQELVRNSREKLFYLPKTLAPRKGRAYVITIGVKSFQNPQWNLEFTADDAKLTAKVLCNGLDRTNRYEDVIPVTLVSDSKTGESLANREDIKSVFDLLAGREVSGELKQRIPNAHRIKEALRPEDLLIIYFSTHGYADTSGDFYLFPSDIGKQEVLEIPEVGKGVKRMVTKELKEKAVSSDMLSVWLRDVDAGELVMIVDACNSSGAVQGENGEELKPGPMGSRGMGQLAYDKGMKILAASQTQVAAGESKSLKQSLLTYALVNDGILKKRADRNKDGAITLNESLRYAEARVPELIKALIKSGDDELKKVKDQIPSVFDFTKSQREIVLVKSVNQAQPSKPVKGPKRRRRS